MDKALFGSGVLRVCNNGTNHSSPVSSTVYLMEISTEFICCRKLIFCKVLMGFMLLLRVLTSKAPIHMLTTIGLTGDPMTSPLSTHGTFPGIGSMCFKTDHYLLHNVMY